MDGLAEATTAHLPISDYYLLTESEVLVKINRLVSQGLVDRFDLLRSYEVATLNRTAIITALDSVLSSPYAPPDIVGTIFVPVIDSKGDLLVGTGPDTITRLPAGANGKLLVTDSTKSTGLDWLDPATLPGGSTDQEVVRDTVAATLVAGANVSITPNDAANTITIASTGGGSTDQEVVRDTVAATLVAGSGVSITPNDASDIITISATGGGTAVTPINPTTLTRAWHLDAASLANGAVSSWSNAGSLGGAATQGTAGRRPVRSASVVNGLPAVLFDGVDDVLLTGNAVTPSSDMTVLAVVSRDWSVWANDAVIASGWGASIGWGLYASVVPSFDWGGGDMIAVGNGYSFGGPRVTTAPGIPLVNGGFHVIGARLAADEPVTTAFVDGALRAARIALPGTIAGFTAPVLIGAVVTDGSGNGLDGLAGYIAEVIVSFSAWTDTQIKGVCAFLCSKYNIEAAIA